MIFFPVNLKPKQKILVYLFGSLGDSIVAIPGLRAIRRRFPNAEIVLLQNFQMGGLVKASEVIPLGLVDRYLSYNSQLGKLAKVFSFFRLWRLLRREHFDAAAYLVISERPEKAVVRDRYFFRACGIKTLFGFHSFSEAELYPVDAGGRPAITEHEALRKLRRLSKDGIDSIPDEDLRVPMMQFSPTDLQRIDIWLADRRLNPSGKLIAVAPGCKTMANAWPLENFIQLGSRLMAEQNCEIIVVGGKAEHETGKKMIAAWGRGINSAGEFSVHDSGALLSRCDLYIGLDTGTTHLAAVAGTRCFALYGERNNQGHWFPLGSGHRVLFHPVPCAGCRFQECPVPGHPCMTGISLESAWSNLKEFIALEGTPSEPVTDVVSV